MQFKVDKLLFFDIETVSQYNDLYDLPERDFEMWMRYYNSFRKRVTEESKITGSMSDEEIFQEVYRQTAAFFPEFGKVACVSMAFVTKTGEVRYESFYGEDEMEILLNTRKVFDKVASLGFDLCGQSVKMFDIPFLGKRFFINGLKTPKMFPTHETKPWEIRVVDTKEVWQFGNNWSLSSLDLVCSALDIDSPKNGDVKGDSVTLDIGKVNTKKSKNIVREMLKL